LPGKLRLQNEIPIVNEAGPILEALERGEPGATDKLLTLVYYELRRVAASKMAQQAPGQTLQPTALVHEAWLRMMGDRNPTFKDRTHFFSAAAEAMRHILIDRARRKLARRHGGEFERVDIETLEIAAPDKEDRLLAVDEALEKFALKYPVQAEAVKLRYFGGMTDEETAHLLGVSVSTVRNYWTFSRAWLFNAIDAK
jgi:RNA polymerase sigma factor (TIGR02999 family)